MYMCTCMFAMYLVLFIVLCYLHIHDIIANIVVCERNKDETKLLIGCENGTLVSYLCVHVHVHTV